MGSTTWKDPDMPKPMPNRMNVVVSRNPTEDMHNLAHQVLRGPDIVNQIFDLHDRHRSVGLDVFIIGGNNLIKQCYNIIEEWLITQIPGVFECDTHLDLNYIHKHWEVKESWDDNDDGLIFQRLTRKKQ